MTGLEAKIKVQKAALDAWKKAGKRGSLQIITGLGKTKIALDAVKDYPKKAKILFLAEQTDRELELRNEQKKWGVNCNIEFACYQTAYKWEGMEFDLVIADEAVDSFTPAYSQFYFNNDIKDLMCLFAYLDTHLVVGQENGKDITKGQLCNKIAPVCFTYGMEQGQIDKTARNLDIYVINHRLDMVNKTMEAGNKVKKWMQTEQAAYDYADSIFRKEWETKKKWDDFRVMRASGQRANVLYKLPSKIEAVKKLLNALNTKSIVFANSLEALDLITPNVISSKKSDKENIRIRTEFDNGETQVIGSFKKLQQGANLTDLDNVILMSYYSKQKIAIQRTGRLRQNGEKGNIFIFVTMNTQEEKWYKSMFEGMDKLRFINCENIDDCLNKLKFS
jgi:superfamily II DNA or RNA helicase